jgi:hypothetical protein
MIRTKIARILSPTRFVLAAGAEDGVQEGMEFIIYELSDPIHDPETSEPLGHLELHKGRVKVIHVQDKLSTATTLPRKVYHPSIGDLLQLTRRFSWAHEGGWVEHPEELPIDQSQAVAVKTDLTVRVGDRARSVE